MDAGLRKKPSLLRKLLISTLGVLVLIALHDRVSDIGIFARFILLGQPGF